jgi:3-hydroxyisobutyrate dehydrogenase
MEGCMIAFLGTGLLGSAFVRAARRRGVAVQVWNRSLDKAEPLAADGAVVCPTPAEAVRGASMVHVALSDDAAVDAVLEQALAGLEPGAAIIDHTTTSPTGAAERTRRWHERGFVFLHAPVFMGPQNALDSTGFMLASGDKAKFEDLAPSLRPMTGKLMYLGEGDDRAAAFKLIGNLFLVALTGGLTDAFLLGQATGISPADVASLFDWFNPGAAVPARAQRMRDIHGKPSWTLAMARKDSRLMLEAAARGDKELVVIPAVAALMDQWLATGHAEEDWSVIARDAVT